jgi:hypothetical protein
MRKRGIDLKKEYGDAKLKLSSLEVRIIDRCNSLIKNNNDIPIKINVKESTINEILNHVIYIEKYLESKNIFVQHEINFN